MPITPWWTVARREEMVVEIKFPEGEREPRLLTGSEEDVQDILDAFPFYVLLVDADHTIVMANKSLYDTFGFEPADVMGTYCPATIHGMDCAFPGCPLEEAHNTGQNVERELHDEEHDTWMLSGAYVTQFVSAEDRPIYLHTVLDITAKKRVDETLTKLRGNLEDAVVRRTRELEATNEELQQEIAERKLAEETIIRLAYYDSLTGLPNRVSFNEVLAKKIQAAKANANRLALALLDLDGFKSVNDTAGHDAGDALLRLVGMRLQAVMREDDSAARMGGDEFLFVLADIRDSAEIDAICRRLLATFDEPFLVNHEEFRITASIGTAIYPDDCDNGPALMKLDDRAMYQAKDSGKNGFARISPRKPESD
jgi:diguanylate cyclase (GGDEF)-like protein